jgi:hypothetical protein
MSNLKKLIMNPEISSVDAGEITTVDGMSYRGDNKYFVRVGSKVITAKSEVEDIQAGTGVTLNRTADGWAIVSKGKMKSRTVTEIEIDG